MSTTRVINGFTAWVGRFTAFALALSAASRSGVDPTADFSFSLESLKDTSSFEMMPEERIAEIFAQRLDLFPKSETPRLARHLMRMCKEYRFDPALILSLIEVESRFRTRVKSPVGAVGLMQLMPATAQYIADNVGIEFKGAEALNDPYTNISLGVAYLSYLREKYRGDSQYFQFAAYNMGPQALNKSRRQADFKPTQTKRYYEKIRAGVPGFRFNNQGSV